MCSEACLVGYVCFYDKIPTKKFGIAILLRYIVLQRVMWLFGVFFV